MNNLKYYNDSLAYDFDMFSSAAPAVKQPERQTKRGNIVKMPAEKKTVSRAAVKNATGKLSAVLMAFVIVAGFCAGIVLRAQINATNAETNKLKAYIGELDSEATALNVEYEKHISYANLEAEATALGMKKMSNDQVVYIRVNDTNKATDAAGNVLE